MRVSDVMSKDVISVEASATVFEAVSKIIQFKVGCVVVTKARKIAGIVTKGDVLERALLQRLDPRETAVEKVMSAKVVTIGKYATLEEASRLMTEKKVSKLPIIEKGELVGIITSSDIIRAEPMEIGYLQELVRARFVPHELA